MDAPKSKNYVRQQKGHSIILHIPDIKRQNKARNQKESDEENIPLYSRHNKPRINKCPYKRYVEDFDKRNFSDVCIQEPGIIQKA